MNGHTFALSPRERAQYGVARSQDILFDAIYALFRQRVQSGMTVDDMALKIDRHPAWVRRAMSGPGHWTLRTFGEMLEALDGEVSTPIDVQPRPDDNTVNKLSEY